MASYLGANLKKGVENVTGLKAIAGIETLDTNILGLLLFQDYYMDT